MSAAAIYMLAVFTLFSAWPFRDLHGFITKDILWHVSVVNSLSHGNLVSYYNFRDAKLAYHFFSDAFIAMGKVIFGYDGFSGVIRFQGLFTSFIVPLSAFAFYDWAFGKRKKPVLPAVFVTLCGYTRGWTYTLNLYTNVNAGAFALPVMFLALYLCIGVLRGRKPGIRDLVFASFVFFVLCGSKGPFAAVAAVSFGRASLIYIIFAKGKRIKDFLLYTLATSAGFAVAMAVLIRGNMSDLAFMPILFFQQVKLSVFGGMINSLAAKAGGSRWALQAVAAAFVPVHFLYITGFIGVAFISAFLRLVIDLVKKREPEKIPERLFLFFICVIGCGAYYLFYHWSSSQGYFLFSVFPALTFIATEELFELLKGRKKILRRAAVLVFAFPIFKNCLDYDIRNIKGYSEYIDMAILSDDLLAGYDYVRENTPEHRLIASNKDRGGENNGYNVYRWYYDAACCDRQFYLSGYTYYQNTDMAKPDLDIRISENKDLYTDRERAKRITSENGIGYVLFYLDCDYGDISVFEDNEDFALVFKNDGLALYKVNGRTD